MTGTRMSEHDKSNYSEIYQKDSVYANNLAISLFSHYKKMTDIRISQENNYANFISTLITSLLSANVYVLISNKNDPQLQKCYIFFYFLSFVSVIFMRLFTTYSGQYNESNSERRYNGFITNKKNFCETFYNKDCNHITHTLTNIFSYIAHMSLFIPILSFILTQVFNCKAACSFVISIVVVLLGAAGIYFLEKNLE